MIRNLSLREALSDRAILNSLGATLFASVAVFSAVTLGRSITAKGWGAWFNEQWPLITSPVGSTQRLHAECSDLARALDMPVEMDHESDAIWNLLKTQGLGQLRWQQYGIETFTCLRLLAASEVSLRAGAAIVFT